MAIEFHPVANIFPLMCGADFESLKADIEANGLLEPIWLHPDGRIIDGRNRYRACLEIGVTPAYRTYSGDCSTAALVHFVVSLNLKRRHLDSGQKAFVALEVERALAEAAKERQIAALNKGPESGIPLLKNLSNGNGRNDNTAAAQAAAIVGTNRQYIADAKRIAEEAPDLAQAVKSGQMKITEARRQLIKRSLSETPPLPTGKYRVLYADPPWQYYNTQPEGSTQPTDYYPTMSIDALCQLPVKELAEDNAVLFVWVTSPLLYEAQPVFEAWGFKYKTSFVWDKVKHNMGHYNSVRHEFLLVCVRGSCQPDNLELYDSVQTIERSNKHSEKPEHFREIIDTLYPYGRRIELFARQQVEGWDTWGNEAEGAIKIPCTLTTESSA